MRFIIMLLFCLFAIRVGGQSVGKVRQLLHTEKFSLLKSYIDSAKTNSNVHIIWVTSRDITSEVRESVFEVTETGHDESLSANVVFNNYKINLLTTKDTIFYFEFNERKSKRIENSQWEEYYYVNTETYKNNYRYENFKASYAQIYNIPLDETDLFLTSLVYGDMCGIGGQPPKSLEEVMKFVEKKEMSSLRLWLKSPNIEKQLYAIRGYKVLSNSGYMLTSQEKNLIEIIKRKKGLVNVCSGCMSTQQGVKAVINEIGLIQNEIKPPPVLRKQTKNDTFLYIGLAIFSVIVIAIVTYQKNIN